MAERLAIDGAGDVILAAASTGRCRSAARRWSRKVRPTSPGEQPVTFLAKLGNDGSFRWAHQYGKHSCATAVAASADGHIALGGTFLEQLDLGGAYTETSGTSTDGYVAKFDGNAKAMWVKQLWGSSNDTYVSGVAFDSYDQVFAAGRYGRGGTLHIGGYSFASTSGTKAFVAKLSKVYGSTLWAKTYGTAGSYVDPQHFSLSGGNRVLLPGRLTGSVNFGSGTITAQNAGFLTRIAP